VTADGGHTPVVPGWRGEVGDWWAEVLGLPAAAVRAGGVYVRDGAGHVGVVAVGGAAAPIVYGPSAALPELREAARAGAGRLVEGRQLAALLGPGPAGCWDQRGMGMRLPRRSPRRTATPCARWPNQICRG
jgi:hypothetical protein